MKLLVASVLFIAACSAWRHELLREGREWVFKYDGQISTGLAQQGVDMAVQRVQSQVRVQLLDSRQAVLSLIEPTFYSANTILSNPRNLANLKAFEQTELSSEQLRLLELPMRFEWINGRVAEVHFDGRDQPWSENIKRAVVNMLQIKLANNKNTEEFERRSTNGNSDYFTTQERTIEGDCETAYTVVKGDDKMEITKSINFEKCTKRVDIRYNYRFGEECSDCFDKKMTAEERNTESQTVVSYKVDGTEDDFVLREVELRSQYVFAPLNKEQQTLATYVVSKLNLVEQREASKITAPKDTKKSSLLYNYETELAREQWFMTGEERFLVKAGYPKMDKLEVVEKIYRQLNKELSSEKNGVEIHSNHLISRLVEVLRMCNSEEVARVWERIVENEDREMSSESRALVVEAMSIAGTKVTVEHLIKKMISKEISSLKAAELVKSFVNIRTPSVEIVDLLQKLSKEEFVRRNPILEQSIWLTTGALMNGVCGIHQDRLALRLAKENECTVEDKKNFVGIIRRKYEQAETRYEKVLALKTIANAGLDVSVHMLEKIIYSKGEDKTVRMQAIDALRQLRMQMPRKIQQILMPLYKSHSEHPEIRMSAVFHIMHTLPQRVVIDQIVEHLTKERDMEVASFTHSLLESFLRSENPCEKKMSEDIEVALHMIKEETRKQFSGRVAHFSLFSETFKLGTTFDFASIFANDSMLPKEIVASLDSVYGGQWNKYFAQIGLTQQNIDRLLFKLINKFEKAGKMETMVRGRRVSVRPAELLRSLMQKMNIKTRQVEREEEDAHAMIYLRYKNLDYVVIPLDEQTIEKVISGFIRREVFDFSEIERVLAHGYRFNTAVSSFVYESSRIIPTTLGLPVKIDGKMPTVAAAQGTIRVQLSEKSPRFQLRAQPSLVTTHIIEMQVIAPFIHTGSKILHSAQINFPVDATLDVKLNDEKLVLETRVEAPKTEKRVIVISTRPTTYIRVLSEESRQYPEIKEKTVVLPMQKRSVRNYEQVFGEEVLGFECSVFGSIHRHLFEDRTFESVAFGENHIELVIRPTENTPEQYRMDVEISMDNERETLKPRFDRFQKSEKRNFFETEKTELLEENDNERRQSLVEYTKTIDMENAYKNRVFVKLYTVGGEKRHIETEIRTVCDNELRFCKLNVEAVRSDKWTLKSNVQILYPETPSTLQQLKEQKHRELQCEIDAEWGRQEKNTFTVRIQGEQDREMKRWIKIADRKDSGLAQYNLLKEAAQLNQYKLVADYTLTPYTKMTVERVFGLLKGYYYMNTRIETARNEEDRVYVRLTVEPETRRYVNLTVETSEEVFRFVDVRSPIRLPLLSIARVNLARHIKADNKINTLTLAAKCEVKSTKVNTFDNLVYKTPLTTCYSVLAKDCSEEPSFAVLMKKVNRDEEEKMMKIVSEDNEFVFELLGEELRCKINGERVTDEDRLMEYGIEKLNEQLVRVELRNVVVKFDGYTAQIKLSKNMQNKQCGLCGHYDGQQDNEFRRADYEETDDIEEFHRSFLVKNTAEKCEIEESKLSEKKHYGIVEDELETYSSEDNLWEEIERSEKSSKKSKNVEWREESETESRPVEKTLVEETSGRICFSVEPVKECRRGYESFETESRKIRFSCLSRSDRRAVQLRREARRNVVDLEDMPISYVHTMHMPKTCVAY